MKVMTATQLKQLLGVQWFFVVYTFALNQVNTCKNRYFYLRNVKRSQLSVAGAVYVDRNTDANVNLVSPSLEIVWKCIIFQIPKLPCSHFDVPMFVEREGKKKMLFSKFCLTLQS